MKTDLIKFLLILLFISSTINLLCGEEEIDHCLQCDTENNETCSLCEDNYFLFMKNILCLPCDNPLYGQYGCGGKCDENN